MFQRNGLALGGDHGLLIHTVGGDGVLPAGQPDGILGHGLVLLQGSPEAVVDPQLVVHKVGGAVLHPVALGEAVALQGVGDGEGEGEGVEPPGLSVVGETEDRLSLGLLHQLKDAVPGKAMLADLVGHAVQQIGVVLEPAQDREEDGRPAGPDIRVPLPQVLRALVAAHRGKLGTQVLNVYGEALVVNGNDHRDAPPLMVVPFRTA